MRCGNVTRKTARFYPQKAEIYRIVTGAAGVEPPPYGFVFCFFVAVICRVIVVKGVSKGSLYK